MLPAFAYQAALNISSSGQCFLSPSEDPVFIEVSSTFLELANLKGNDLIGKRFFEVFPVDPNENDISLEQVKESFKRVLKTGAKDTLHLQRYPIKVFKEDGSFEFEDKYWNASNTPIFDDEGNLVYISHQTCDVTDRVHAENALKKSEARYHSLTQSIDEGFCVIEIKFDNNDNPVDYKFHEVNPVFEAQTGLKDAAGKTMREMVPKHESKWFEIYGNVAKTEKPIRFESESEALGRIFDVYAYPLDEGSGNMVGILFRDVTEVRKDEEQLRVSESRLRVLISATAEVIYRMSPDWSEIYQLEGRGFLEDVIDSKKLWINEYIPADEQAKLKTALDKCISTKTKLEIELRVILTDGSIGWIETRAIPMLDVESGEITEWLGASTDITFRKNAEEDLREASRKKDDFLAMLAHELRNPLAPISAAAQILQLSKFNQEKIDHYCGIISRQVNHMTELINDLLDMSRVNRGLITLDIDDIDLTEVISHSIEQVKPLFTKHSHQLTYNLPEVSILVRGDRHRLIQVVSNILNNAGKYTPDNGKVDLILEEESPYAKITVKDNGIGMEAELLKKVFELFIQATRTPDRSQGGLGIGLALAKSLVDLHDGQISASSAGLAKGSQFQILLPLVSKLND